MSKFSRIVVLVTALASLFAVMSSTAGAVTWHNEGSTTFHATGGAATLSFTGAGSPTTLPCAASTATANAPVGTFTSAVYRVTGTLRFTPCSLIGQSTYVDCTFTLTALTWSAGVTAGPVDVTCDARLEVGNVGLCHVDGSTPGSYTNPSGLTPGRFTLTSPSTLTVTNFGSTSCPIGTGSDHLTEHTLNLTPGTAGPIITRTA
jgi:hypothetical protein